jgi:GT2 family glycosyltransferase
MTTHERDDTTVSNGYLPLEPFAHLCPTSVAVLDLEGGLTPAPAGGRHGRPAKDALVLIRLHGEPLGLVHLDRPLCDVSAADLGQIVLSRCAGAILRHARASGCMTPPSGAADLGAGLGSAATCAGAQSPPAPGSVALIVPTSARRSQLRRCLASVGQLRGLDFEVIVVNNGPRDAEIDRVVADAAEAGMPVRCVNETRPGSSVARNRGIAETRADIVAFTDDDVVLDPDWLRWLIAPFSAADVGAATGMVLPLELEAPAQKRFEQLAGFSRGLTQRSFDLRSHDAERRFLYPYAGGVFGSGNSMAFRRSSIVALGGFDPALGAGSRALAGADIDALSGVVLRGERLVYDPRSLCWHEHRKDDAELRRQIFNYGVGFTAILTKAALRDRRFAHSVARSLPMVVSARRSWRARTGEANGRLVVADYVRINRSGMLRGPQRYLQSVVWSHKLGLDRVIAGG